MQIPNLAIAITLDKSGLVPVIKIIDSTVYPGGVPNNITGIVSITQPDNINVSGSFSSPDIFYFNGALIPAVKELRLANDFNFQKGQYVISYTVRHPSYDETVVTKAFNIDYVKPTGVLNAAFDVFTPSLKIIDSTDYVVPNFTLQSVARGWAATSTPGNIVGPNLPQFDLSINSAYYDAEYNVTLTSTLNYTLTNAIYVTLIDSMVALATYDTVKPDSLNTIFTSISTFKDKMGSIGTCQKDFDTNKANYIYAYTLFEHFKSSGLCGNRGSLVNMYNELKAVLNNGVFVPYTVTNTPLPSYDFSNFCGCCDSAAGILLQIVSQPVSLTRNSGQSATFSVTAVGTATLTYQWRKNGVNIGGPQTSSYTIPSVSNVDQASYDVVVTDGLGNHVTSTVATLTVMPAIVTFTANWGWFATDPTANIQGGDTLTYQGSGTFNTGSNITADFRSAPALQYYVLKYPNTESLKSIFFNTSFEQGPIPGILFKRIVVGSFIYIISNQPITFDANALTIFS